MKCAAKDCMLSDELRVESCSACPNYVHHICSNEFFEGGSLAERYCSAECVQRRSVRGLEEERERSEIEETLSTALLSFETASPQIRWEWESFKRIGFTAFKCHTFTPVWTTYKGDCFYDSVCRSPNVPFYSPSSLRKGTTNQLS